MGQGRVESDLEAASVALNLGEHEPTLETREHAGREGVGIRVVAQGPVLDHPNEPIADEFAPGREGRDEVRPSVLVDVSQTARERTERATAAARARRLARHDHVAPVLEILEAVELLERRTVVGEHALTLALDDRVDEVVLVSEVVVELDLLVPVAARTSSRLTSAAPRSKMRSAAASMMRWRVARPFRVGGVGCGASRKAMRPVFLE